MLGRPRKKLADNPLPESELVKLRMRRMRLLQERIKRLKEELLASKK